MRNIDGFTLIECLVALFIVAIVVASSSRAIGVISSDLRDTFVIEAATWASADSINEMNIKGDFPDIGENSKDVSMAGIDFVLKKIITNTPNPYFRKVEIVISEKKSPDVSIYRTVNFVAQY